jgi:hypothetical protein
MIHFAPLKRLDLDPKVMSILKTLKPYSYFKGGVARDALINHFTPEYVTRATKPNMDFDFVVFGDDVEWDEGYGEEEVIFNDDQYDEFDRLHKLGDVERHWSVEEYFKSRDNTLNQVLLGQEGLYFTNEAKRSACSVSIDMTSDDRPRAVLRNILFALRYGHSLPKADLKKALREASVIDLLIPLLKSYRLGLEVDFYWVLARHNKVIRLHRDPDDYLISLVKEFELERGRPFEPKESADKRTLQEVLERTRYQ